MKRTFRILTALVAALILSPAISVVAQEMPQMPQLPVDPGVRIGKLDNLKDRQTSTSRRR